MFSNFFYKFLSWHENKTEAPKELNQSFCVSLITNSNIKLKTTYMISKCNTHNSIFTLSYVSGLNINSTIYAIIFKRGHYEGVLISLWPDQKGNKLQRPNSDLYNTLPTKLNTLHSSLL
jgi:hypothetical protein